MSIDELRQRRSAKWRAHAPDVLPLAVAEMDVRLAPAIADALRAAIDASDTGYNGDGGAVADAFTAFARRRWGWNVDGEVALCADVAVGVTEVLRRRIWPGDEVVVLTPTYPAFRAWLHDAGAVAVEVPLRQDSGGWYLDLAAIELAFECGARGVLLANPHNPTGCVHTAGQLRALAALAEAHAAFVIADEVHAPLTFADTRFHPYLSVSSAAARTGIALHSPSKAWNVAGLKCALIVTVDPAHSALLASLPHELPWGTGHLGAIAATAAYQAGEPWLDAVIRALAGNAHRLAEALAVHLPDVAFVPPDASFNAWLDCRGLGLEPDPALVFLERGRVALARGADFGAEGAQFVRLNLACSHQVLDEVVVRMARSLPIR